MKTRARLPFRIAAVFVLYCFAIVPAFGDDGEGYLRFDPIYEQMIPVPAEELKKGYIYSHYSPRRNQRVWSFYLGDGRFWNALGEGTTQLGRLLDIRQDPAEALEELREVNPEFARQIDQSSTPPRVELNAEGKWVPLGTREVLSVFDAETSMRWENHGFGYVPVVSLYGNRWVVHEGRYIPAAVVHSVH